MPIIDHSRAPEVPWRPGYRKWDITQCGARCDQHI